MFPVHVAMLNTVSSYLCMRIKPTWPASLSAPAVQEQRTRWETAGGNQISLTRPSILFPCPWVRADPSVFTGPLFLLVLSCHVHSLFIYSELCLHVLVFWKWCSHRVLSVCQLCIIQDFKLSCFPLRAEKENHVFYFNNPAVRYLRLQQPGTWGSQWALFWWFKGQNDFISLRGGS